MFPNLYAIVSRKRKTHHKEFQDGNRFLALGSMSTTIQIYEFVVVWVLIRDFSLSRRSTMLSRVEASLD
ncbi:hypothetical protein BRADI_1g40644v3 [Brachypodium distachyon]|uniref:Uncharacterized protein n=1 Tax=Brachypodium distachyon TaxID=15368 RepID=A0A2K2DNN2_BRADI|nr:hypothetical protein BRADI_1g40644v3 [Brachypodium distachyon]